MTRNGHQTCFHWIMIWSICHRSCSFSKTIKPLPCDTAIEYDITDYSVSSCAECLWFWPTNNPSIFNQYVLIPQYHCPLKRSTIILYTMPFYENSQSPWNRLEILGSKWHVSIEFCAHSFHKGIVVNGIIVKMSLSDVSMRKCVYVCLCVCVCAYACAYTYAYFITQDPYQFLSWYAGSRVQTNNNVFVAWWLPIPMPLCTEKYSYTIFTCENNKPATSLWTMKNIINSLGADNVMYLKMLASKCIRQYGRERVPGRAKSAIINYTSPCHTAMSHQQKGTSMA